MLRVAYAGALFSAWACGYHVLDAPRALGTHRLVVLPFSESEPVGLSAALGDALRREAAASGMQLGTDAETTDLLLRGRVIATTTAPSAMLQSASVTAYETSVTIVAELRDAAGKRLWQQQFSFGEDFRAASDAGPNSNLTTETGRRRALLRIAERAGKEIWATLLVAGTGRDEKDTAHGSTQGS